MEKYNKDITLLLFTQKIDKDDPLLGFFHAWVCALAKHFSYITVICLQKGSHTLPDNVRVLSLGKEEGVSRIQYVYRFYRYVLSLYTKRQFNAVFVHMNEIYVGLLIPLFALLRMRCIPIMWWKTHGHLSALSRVSLRFVQKILTASEKSFPVGTPKKSVIGHGIDTDIFSPKKSAAPTRKIHILAIGRMSPVKKYEVLIDALAHKKEQGQAVPPTSIVGSPVTGQDRVYYQKLIDRVEQKNLSSFVSFVPHVRPAEVISLYREADILVNTSETHSLDKVVLEAMACGLIPITSNSAFPDMLSAFPYCVVRQDPVALAKSIDHVMALKKKERELLGSDLREIVVRDHNLDALAENVYNAYCREVRCVGG